MEAGRERGHEPRFKVPRGRRRPRCPSPRPGATVDVNILTTVPRRNSHFPARRDLAFRTVLMRGE